MAFAIYPHGDDQPEDVARKMAEALKDRPEVTARIMGVTLIARRNKDQSDTEGTIMDQYRLLAEERNRRGARRR